MSALSNTLADLAEQVKSASAASATAERTAIDKALEGGALLATAKDECKHGEWLLFLERAGVHERQAHRLMTLARSGLKPDMVSDLGGIGAALEWLRGRHLPRHGEILLVEVEDTFAPDFDGPLSLIYPELDGFQVVTIDLDQVNPQTVVTRKRVLKEWMVWETLYGHLDRRLPEMVFTMMKAETPWLEMIADARNGGTASWIAGGVG